MSTNINITVSSGDLSDKVKRLQQAARQEQLDKERQQRLEVQGTEQRKAKLEAEGRAPDGSLLYGARFDQPQIERRPAATRFVSSETVMSWVLYIGDKDTTDIVTGSGGLPRASSDLAYKGTNDGLSIYLSSTDGTYWLNAVNNIDLQKPEGFRPGDPTSGALTNFQNIVQRFDIGLNNTQQHFDIFPVGNGRFVATFRFGFGLSKAWWNRPSFLSDPDYGGCISSLRVVYKSFLVSKSRVKEIQTPQGVKDYFDGKFPQFEPVPVYFRQYSPSGQDFEFSETPERPNLRRETGPALIYRVKGGVIAFSSLLNTVSWLNGWWQRALPPANNYETVGIFLTSLFKHGSPAVYSRALDLSTNLPTNDFASNTEARAWWDSAWVQDQTRMKKPIAHYLGDYSITQASPMSLVLPIYEAIYARPEGTQWRDGITPRIAPTDAVDPPYWAKIKELSFSPLAQPFPVTTYELGRFSTKYLCVSTDWGVPSYCRQQALALGFLPSDLTP